ncbi:MAG: hypothetical protein GTO53_10785, partial [Planctomycetales bacterium]|nr:hypothetical protein [Planctomycetales bacterium]NIM09604.1 hypothetical protein [Planctomycetales bacterium]NIN09093.1 hypothetical protein [Planctomycetales bacterium]NIN78200.1 hypothetical protein [Planctomycetales bacterium]NIO35391.1 hypothetical protein [Planctomycetales bacterium]
MRSLKNTIAGRVRPATRLAALGVAILLNTTLSQACQAQIVIVANRSQQTVRFAVADIQGDWRKMALQPGELVPIPVRGKAKCQLILPSERRPYELVAHSLYLVRADDDQPPQFQRITFGLDTLASKEIVARQGADWKGAQIGTIRVRVLVDDEDRRRDSIWQEKMKKRLEAANQALEYYCRMRIEIVEFGRWVSDNQLKDFKEALAAFEKTVPKGSADVAIGFTSQFPVDHKIPHAGGTRGPLRSHILIREYGLRVSEVERLEILLHELGHYLGAAHSPERGSLMRTVLGDGQANLRSFRVAYDPYNTLAMNIVADQWRQKNVRQIQQLDQTARQRLAAIYSVIAQFYSEDPVALNLLSLVTQSPEHGILAVRHAVLQVALANQKRIAQGKTAYANDALMTLYVRTAATVAARLPPRYGRQAFLLGLGLSLDQHNLLNRFSPIAREISLAEPPNARRERLRVIGKPTIHGRTDLVSHFLVSAVLTLAVGADAAQAAGILKEISDTHGGSGFSFADVAANLAGVEMAEALQNNKLNLAQLEKNFQV